MGSDDYVMVPRSNWLADVSYILANNAAEGDAKARALLDEINALHAAPPSPRSGEPDCVMWCKSCGTVTADRECDCTRTDHPELQELVPNTESTIEALMNERLELLAKLSAAPPSPRSDDGEGKPVAWRWRNSVAEPWTHESWDYMSGYAQAELSKKHRYVQPLFAAPPSPTPSVEVGEMVERLKEHALFLYRRAEESGPIYAAASLLLSLDAERGRMEKLLNGRDDFIVSKGLFGEFVAALPASDKKDSP